jgi:oligopeptide/dipeptide ABC transporter ATP-binding protein
VNEVQAGPLVSAEGLSKHYMLRGRGSLRAVEDVNLRIEPGETFALVGETGSGKSTTGRLLLGLERPSSGRVVFEGRDLATLGREELRSLRREMQPVSQDPYSALNPRMRVRQILAEPFVVHNVARSGQLDARLEELISLVQLPAAALDRYPHEFSGGQRQRIVIARAIALRPRFVVCDEPVSALDVSVQAQIINLLRRLQRELGLTYLFISHDLAVVHLVSDRIGVMYLGRLVEVASRRQLFDQPEHPYTQALLAAAPVADPRSARRRPGVRPRGEATNVIDQLIGCPFAPRCPLAEDRCRQVTPELRELATGHLVACHLATPTGPNEESSQPVERSSNAAR